MFEQETGYDPEGNIGEITWLKLVSRKTGGLVTANRPVMVAFKVRAAKICI